MTKKVIEKCGVQTATGDSCTLLAKPHDLHACWVGWERGIRVWGARDVVEAK